MSARPIIICEGVLKTLKERKNTSEIFIRRTNEFGVYEALKEAFIFFKVGFNFDVVAVKLNLCTLKLRETGATSDPIVVEQLVRLLNENNVQVRLVESDSAGKDADLAFKYLGFKKLEKKYEVECVNLSKDEFSIRKTDGYYLKSIKMPQTIENADFFISHPKLKTHCGMKIRLTGALKNQFGCLMKKRKSFYHPKIHEIIADVNQAFTPGLIIMDGIIAMTGYGPVNGIPQRLNLILTSLDPVAVDALGARIFGFNPSSIKYIKLASEKGIDLRYVSGTGPGSRIVERDIEAFLKIMSSEGPKIKEEKKFFGIQKLTAKKVTESYQKIPQLTHVMEVDMTNLSNYRKQLFAKEGKKSSKKNNRTLDAGYGSVLCWTH